jgi:hypothetical protein
LFSNIGFKKKLLRGDYTMKKFEFGRFKIGNTETYRRINVRIIQGILISKCFHPNLVMILLWQKWIYTT